MKVLLVNGSPHPQGSTNRALEEVAITLQENGIETEIFWIGNKPISGCLGCGQCRKEKKCIIEDVVLEIQEKAKECDGFIFGTPVHYASPSGNMLSLMDRLFYSASGQFYMKPAATVVSTRRSGATAAFDVMNKYYTISQMPVVSSTYWNNVHGNAAEETIQDEEGMLTMRNLGRNMAYILKCLEAGKEKGVALPDREPRKFTNFIRKNG